MCVYLLYPFFIFSADFNGDRGNCLGAGLGSYHAVGKDRESCSQGCDNH